MKILKSINKKSIYFIAVVFFLGGIIFSIVFKPFLILFFIFAGMFTVYRVFSKLKNEVIKGGGIKDITPQKTLISHMKTDRREKLEKEIIVYENNYMENEENKRAEEFLNRI